MMTCWPGLTPFTGPVELGFGLGVAVGVGTKRNPPADVANCPLVAAAMPWPRGVVNRSVLASATVATNATRNCVRNERGPLRRGTTLAAGRGGLVAPRISSAPDSRSPTAGASVRLAATGAAALHRTSASGDRISSSSPGSVGGRIGMVGRAARRIGGRVSGVDCTGALVGGRIGECVGEAVGASGSGGSGGRSNAGDDATVG